MKIILEKEHWNNPVFPFGEVQLKVITDPVPCIIKSRYKLVNWWRKITKTEEHGYSYTVQIYETE